MKISLLIIVLVLGSCGTGKEWTWVGIEEVITNARSINDLNGLPIKSAGKVTAYLVSQNIKRIEALESKCREN